MGNVRQRMRKSFLLTFVVAVAIGCTTDSTRWARPNESEEVDGGLVQSGIDAELRDELLAMSQADQQIRKALIAAGLEQPNKELLSRMTEIDAANQPRIKGIIEKHGWPGRSLVGEEGATAAFLLVQHADRDPDFQKSALPLLRAAYEAGEASGEHLALLTDRVLVAEGKPQRYGTQVEIESGSVVIKPVEDESNLDNRRKRLGLEPMAEYLKTLREIYGLE